MNYERDLKIRRAFSVFENEKLQFGNKRHIDARNVLRSITKRDIIYFQKLIDSMSFIRNKYHEDKEGIS